MWGQACSLELIRNGCFLNKTQNEREKWETEKRLAWMVECCGDQGKQHVDSPVSTVQRNYAIRNRFERWQDNRKGPQECRRPKWKLNKNKYKQPVSWVVCLKPKTFLLSTRPALLGDSETKSVKNRLVMQSPNWLTIYNPYYRTACFQRLPNGLSIACITIV